MASPLLLWCRASATDRTSVLPIGNGRLGAMIGGVASEPRQLNADSRGDQATGSVKGLRTRGNFTVDIECKNGKLLSATIHSPDKNSGTVRAGGRMANLKIKAGGTIRLNGNLQSF